MILQNEICHIVINIDETYTVDSADNRHYDVTLNPGDYGRSDFSKTLAIHIDLYSKVSRRLVKEDVYSIVESCFMPFGIECDQYPYNSAG